MPRLRYFSYLTQSGALEKQNRLNYIHNGRAIMLY